MPSTNRLKDTKFKRRCLLLFFSSWLLGLTISSVWASPAANQEPQINLLKPDPRGGIAYKLVYYVDVPLETYWRFKTDFDNSFLLTNKYIKEHRLLDRAGNSVITENKYNIGPDATYKWKTKVMNGQHRLEYQLLNPGDCGQKFHFGYIQAQAEGDKTLVTQVAYLDFFGVSFWAYYPWSGGMNDFLRNTVHWEQETAVRLEWRYAARQN